MTDRDPSSSPPAEIVPSTPERKPSRPPQSGVAEMQGLVVALKAAIEPQAKAQVELAKIEADSQKHQTEQEATLIAAEQQMRHSRFRHWFWGVAGFCAAFFLLALVLIWRGKDQEGFLILSHGATLLAGAFGGRAIGREKGPSQSGE